jgi:MGT family glycosyltransferase
MFQHKASLELIAASEKEHAMAVYVFLPYPASGPVNPTLAIAQGLVDRGQTVIYYLPEAWAETVRATGALFRPYESRLAPSLSTKEPQQAQESRQVLPQILEQIRADAPDVIVHDPFSAWTSILVRILAVQAVFLHSSYPMNEHFNVAKLMADLPGARARVRAMREIIDKENAALAAVCGSYHVAPVEYQQLASCAEQLNIVFIPRAFQPAGETFDERYLFVGPSLRPRSKTPLFPFERLSAERPLLYISLGSLFTNQPTFFRQCFEAFGKLPWQVVLSVGNQVQVESLGPIPENFLLAAYVPQLEILPRAGAFVTHGGVNSAMESLYYGVPMVAIPQETMDQAVTARRLVELGLSIALSKAEVTAETLCRAVERLVNDEAIHQKVGDMQRLAHEAGGYQRAVEALMRFAHEHVSR